MAYKTIQGQTWDQVSKEVYGTEMNAGRLMQANPKQLGIFIFPADVILVTPEIDSQITNLPPWRRING